MLSLFIEYVIKLFVVKTDWKIAVFLV